MLQLVKSEVKTETPSITKPIQQLKKEPVETVALKAPMKNIQENLTTIKSLLENEAKTAIQKTEPANSNTIIHKPQPIILMLQSTMTTMFFMMFLQNNSKKQK